MAIAQSRERTASAGPDASPRRPEGEAVGGRGRRWPRRLLLVVGVATLVILGVCAYLFTAYELRADPGARSVSSAIHSFHGSGSVPSAAGATYGVPKAGVYSMKGEGLERISLPPNSQKDGTVMPVTVSHLASGCWRWRIDYNVAHWQDYVFCTSASGLLQPTNRVYQAWDFGAMSITNLATISCPADTVVLPSDAKAGTVLSWTCPEHNTAVGPGASLHHGPHHRARDPAHRRRRSPGRGGAADRDRLGHPNRQRRLGLVAHGLDGAAGPRRPPHRRALALADRGRHLHRRRFGPTHLAHAAHLIRRRGLRRALLAGGRRPARWSSTRRQRRASCSTFGRHLLEQEPPLGLGDRPPHGVRGVRVHRDRGDPEPHQELGELGAVRGAWPHSDDVMPDAWHAPMIRVIVSSTAGSASSKSSAHAWESRSTPSTSCVRSLLRWTRPRCPSEAYSGNSTPTDGTSAITHTGMAWR